jgi:hypothetical protein
LDSKKALAYVTGHRKSGKMKKGCRHNEERKKERPSTMDPLCQVKKKGIHFVTKIARSSKE